MEKGNGVMRIAVTYKDGEVFQHFGHSEQFKLYDTEGEKITGEQIVDTNGSGHGTLAGFLQATIMNTITAIVVMSIVQTMVAMEIRDRTNLMDLFLTFAKS
jgi:predicted Fe-Mo cluster-binding NifX family protein